MNLDIVYVTDEGFYLPSLISINSIRRHKGINNYNIYVICHQVDKKHIKTLNHLSTTNFNVHTIELSDDSINKLSKTIEYLPSVPHVSSTALYKFIIPELFPDLDKVLYIDGDTVINRDLEQLFSTDIEDVFVAAVGDPHAFVIKQHISGYNRKYYFNSGVMLLNLKKMREYDISKKLINYRLHSKCDFMDQDTFNKILFPNIKLISPLFNFFTPPYIFYDDELYCKMHGLDYQSIEEFKKSVVIFHFAGPWKPWKYYNVYGAVLWKYYTRGLPLKYKFIPRTYLDVNYERLNLDYDLELHLLNCHN